jgi:PAS domain S-box-containing protein
MSLDSAHFQGSSGPASGALRTRAWRLRALIPAAVVLAASAISGGWTYQFALRQERARAESQFFRQVDRAKSLLDERIGRIEVRLRALNGLFSASEHVHAAEFHAFARLLELDDPEVGVSWVAFFRRASQDPGAAPALAAPEFAYPPDAPAVQWRGAANGALRLPEVDRSRATPICTAQNPDDPYQAQLILPVTPRSIASGDASAAGWLVAEISAETVFSAIVEEGSGVLMESVVGAGRSELSVRALGGRGPAPDTLDGQADAELLIHSWHASLGDGLWMFTLRSGPGFESAFRTNQPMLLLVGELGIGVIAAGLALALATIGARARTLAAGMTAELSRKEQYYRAIVEDQTELICRFTPDGALTFVNEAYCRYFCREREELLGRPFDPAILETDRASVQRRLSGLTRVLPVGGCVYRAIVPGGEQRWQEWTYRAIFDPQGSLIEYQAVGRDVTEERTMQNALRKSLARIEESSRELSLRQYALDQAAIVCMIDSQGAISQANDSLCTSLGCERKDILGQQLRDWGPDDADRRICDELQGAANAGDSWKGELRLRAANGSLLWLDATVIPCARRDGSGDRHFVIGRDITEQRLASDNLRLSEERLDLAVRGSNVGLWDWDMASGHVYYSSRFRELLGYHSEEELSGEIEEFECRLHPEDRDRYRTALENHLARQEPFDIEVRVRAAAGDYRWLHSRAGAAFDASGRAVRMAGSVTDITEKKRNEAALEQFAADLVAAKTTLEQQAAELEAKGEELERARFAAEAANRAKSDFLANMSHEIRTPMTAILGYADLLLEPGQSAEERKDCVQIVRRNGEHLLSIINDILDISKIEAGRMTVELLECDPWAIARDVIEMLGARARLKDITLGVETVGAIPTRVHSDPTRLKQILLNLVGNAIKFTESGGVRVLVRMAENRGSESARIAFEVIDTGIGMSPEQAERLFQPFTQADHSMTRRFGGTGLGLTISKRLAEMLGGRIEVTTSP